MSEQQQVNADAAEPGMVVETTEGDLGEHDISKPKVKEVVRDAGGDVERLVVEKGVVFKKVLEVPADRVTQVEQTPEPGASQGDVVIDANEEEIAGLKAVGAEELAAKSTLRPDADDPLSELEEEIPTAEGQRRNEAEAAERRQRERDGTDGAATAQPAQPAQPTSGDRPRFSLRQLGPGLLAGMSGNDSTAVTAYAVTGATTGYGQLWLMLLATPLYQAVLYACGKIGRITRMGLTEVLRKHYGRKLAVPIAVLLLIGNVALIAGDLVAIGSGLELITGIGWVWFVVPAAAILWYLTVYESFGKIKKIFLTMSLVFIAYLFTGFFSHANWGDVLRGTFVPRLSFSFVAISSAMALLGATLSPYTMFWQAQAEKEQKRPGTTKQQMKLAALDIGSGTVGGNLVSYFIILTTAATLFNHQQQITTAADAAKALEPLVGPVAKYLFAVGFIGAGVVAIPVLLASTSYALSGTFGWSASLWKKPWQSEGFYLIITAALVAAVVLALLGFNPIQFIFFANVLQGILAPILIVVILLVANNRAIMGAYRLGKLTNFWLGFAALITAVGAVLLFYGLLKGQSG